MLLAPFAMTTVREWLVSFISPLADARIRGGLYCIIGLLKMAATGSSTGNTGLLLIRWESGVYSGGTCEEEGGYREPPSGVLHHFPAAKKTEVGPESEFKNLKNEVQHAGVSKETSSAQQ